MSEIPLSRGLIAVVDDEDYGWLCAYKWHANAYGYAVRRIHHPTKPDSQTSVFMHREILSLEFGDKRQGDHINFETLDNRRSNLRVATASENGSNRRLLRGNTSGLKGVTWHKRDRKWQAAIGVGNGKKYLGYFDTAEQAHEAYCKAAAEVHGEFANLGTETVPAGRWV